MSDYCVRGICSSALEGLGTGCFGTSAEYGRSGGVLRHDIVARWVSSNRVGRKSVLSLWRDGRNRRIRLLAPPSLHKGQYMEQLESVVSGPVRLSDISTSVFDVADDADAAGSRGRGVAHCVGRSAPIALQRLCAEGCGWQQAEAHCAVLAAPWDANILHRGHRLAPRSLGAQDGRQKPTRSPALRDVRRSHRGALVFQRLVGSPTLLPRTRVSDPSHRRCVLVGGCDGIVVGACDEHLSPGAVRRDYPN